ncbi:MAG: hypothetical protein AB7U97_21320, partial [Pirellulales bacterium]
MVRPTSPNRPTGPGLISGRVALRLFSLLLAAGVVSLLIRELGRPQVAERVDQVMEIEPLRQVKADPSPTADPAQFQELLQLAGWDAKRFARLQEGEPLSDANRDELSELLWRLRSFDAPQLAAWAQGSKLNWQDAAPAAAGELALLTGRVTSVTRRELPADLAARLEMPSYYECEMTLDADAGKATIFTDRVPNAWLEMKSLAEPAAASAIFIRRLSDDAAAPHALFVSREIAWHPIEPNLPFVSLGESILGGLGVDVGLLDSLRQRQSIGAPEAEAFYSVLSAAGQIGANQLDRFARRQLPSIAEHWAAEERKLKESPGDKSPQQLARLQLAREVQKRAAEGLYSVAPLFNDAANQVGELVAFEGTVRRVTPIDADKFRYYELDLFTDDSQNNPIVVCVRDLPPGFPVGDHLHEPVRIAGWFLKVWSFESRRATLRVAPDGSATPQNLRQFAPLVIGRSPVLLESPAASTSAYATPVAAALFLTLLAVIWTAGWWIFREDKRFARTLAKQYSLPAGESLDDLKFDLSEGTPPH